MHAQMIQNYVTLPKASYSAFESPESCSRGPASCHPVLSYARYSFIALW